MFGALFGGRLLALCGLPSMFIYFAYYRSDPLCSRSLSRETDALYPQDPDAELDANELVFVPVEEAQHKAESAFQQVFENGPKIELDHYIVYYARGLHFLCLHSRHQMD